MTRTTHVQPSDIRGYARLATQATTGLTDLVEAMHDTIARPLGGAKRVPGRTRGLTGLVYKSVRGVTRLVGGGLDAILALLRPEFAEMASSREREAVLAALNGVLGDYLFETGNPLAIPMSLRKGGRVLEIESRALASAYSGSSGKLVVLVHGLCMNDLQWARNGHDHGAALAARLGRTPLYLHYNTGVHVSTNGRALSDLLESVLGQWPEPIDQIEIVAHSMGGLVARSAYHYGTNAGRVWTRRLGKIVFLGTPHHGAPLERGGHWIDMILGATRFTAPFTRLGAIRSAGITDLRHGNVLDEQWQGHDRFARVPDASRLHLPLPDAVECFAIAASAGDKPGSLRGKLIGDGLVPVNSALGRHRERARALSFPRSHRWIGYGMNHMDLLGRREVCDRIVRWLASR
ncbi:MAG: GPI inositol-deacylase [Burkholderiaceae bacterium]|nr:GPI inositol-deacylase [Burkholderiaceae bacterium]